jgi:hypothetical protein
MRHINFDVSLNFDTPEDRWRSEQLLLYMLTTLTLRNFWFLLDTPDFPKLYDTGMVYMLPEQLERRSSRSKINKLDSFLSSTMGMSPSEIQHHLDLAKGVEIFRDIPRMMEHGGGDCDNWACARAAEIAVAAHRLGGKSGVKPYLVWREDGDRMIYHAKIMHGDGTDEDPSIIMGMGGSDKAFERREECRKNYERYDNMWQRAKSMMADEDFRSEDERVARATELKAACDSFGYLPKSGVFRVGPAKTQALVGGTHNDRRNMLGLDLLGAARSPLLGRGGHGGRHHGGHGRIHQSWGFGGAPTYIIDVEPDELDIDYEYGVVSAAPAPRATIVPGRRAA